MAQPDQTGPWSWGGPRSVDLNCLRRADAGPAMDKPYFAPVAEVMSAIVADKPDASLLDVGCSSGGFLAYLLRRWPELRCTGVDLHRPVVDAAIENVPGARFMVGDLLSSPGLPVGEFDVVTMLGIHSLFDDPGCWIEPAAGAVRSEGSIIVFGLFNPEPVDVLARLRDRRPGVAGDWQTGWNLWSRVTIEDELTARGLRWSWHGYEPAGRVGRWSADPLHSWTAELDGRAVTLNGGQIVHRQDILEVTVP